jgi:hypothetical protein
MPAIRAAHLDDLLLGVEKIPTKTTTTKDGDSVMEKNNLDYLNWVTHDQALLGYLFSSLTHEVLQGVTMLTTSGFGMEFASRDVRISHSRGACQHLHHPGHNA